MRVEITVPATSANMGSGFDSLGLAVRMYNRVVMEPWDRADIASLDGTQVPRDENNLIYKTAKYLFDICGKPLTGLRIRQENAIPMARGLGSSSACIVAGLMGANALMGSPLTREDLIDMAATMEGHPDNSTPAILGGQVTAAIENGRVFYCRQELPGDLRFAAVIPDFELKTSAARAALPKEVSRGDGVFNLSRSALMAMSLAAGKYENLRVAAQDRLHQPYRLGLIPGAEKVMDCALEFGAYCAYISGAGSTLMAIVGTQNAGFAQHLRCWMDGQGFGTWRLELLEPDNRGARLSTVE
jgi:homoserine kinase